jgi:hypothetical protein
MKHSLKAIDSSLTPGPVVADRVALREGNVGVFVTLASERARFPAPLDG